ncbi:MAG: restriction endonuclease subunit S [Firmicutes bacterium]|nr:restriction endonuclease subunit S [Bacillota bacterium]
MKKITLGDLCEPSAGQLKLDKDTLVDYFDISSVDNVSKTTTGFTTYSFGEAPSRARKAVKRNSILVSTVRPNLNAVALFDEETDNIPVASTGFCVLDCKKGINPRFVFNFCRSKAFIEDMTSQATGASYPAVSDKIIRSAKIPDYSEKEQTEISDTLDRVAEVIELRKKEFQKLDELVKARFVEMFGDAVNNDRGWQSASVESVCREIFGGGTPSKSHPEYYENGDIPWVSSKDMKTDVLYDSQIKINQLGVDNSTARMVPINSVIMVIRSGILKHTLPVAINAVPLAVNQDLKVFVPGDRIITRFMAMQLKMHEKDILSGVRAVTADNIEFNSLKQRLLIIPPIDLQNEFVAFAEQVDKSKVIVMQIEDKLNMLY